MSNLRSKFFWAAYGKTALTVTVGFGLAALCGVPAESATTLAAGAMISFPAIYSFSSGQRSPSPE